MGHTKPENLEDLAKELSEIRGLKGPTEKSPGIFYYRAAGFLHFHDKGRRRWADVKVHGDWTELKIDFESIPSQRRSFLSRVKKAHKDFS